MTFWKPDDGQREFERNLRYQPVEVKSLTVIAETNKAILVVEDFESCGDKPRQIWLPRSQITNCIPPLPSLEKDDVIESLWVPRWLADEKELLYT